MKPSIENPKVFISYAWSNEEYQNKVLSFATALMNDGVDVLFDKWSLKEGNDTYAFMEKSVVDEKVTNVLILLDPVYEEKANNRQGGVGTETQIISNEVYNKTDQTKFLPIVFERKENGDIPKPVYLKQTLHFDLTNDDTYTYCSNMAKTGINPKTLQYFMGHSDIGVTLNTYTHVKFEDAKEDLKRSKLI